MSVSLAADQLDELRPVCRALAAANEGGLSYLLLEGILLPENCEPTTTDALLCPEQRDGYSSRLFFASKVRSPGQLNWNAEARILERNWHAFSWRTPPGLRLAQMVAIHLKALR